VAAEITILQINRGILEQRTFRVELYKALALSIADFILHHPSLLVFVIE
jgi:hypothetical protein